MSFSAFVRFSLDFQYIFVVVIIIIIIIIIKIIIIIIIIILCSDDTPVDFSAANLANLQEKHSPSHAGALSPPNSADKPAVHVSEEAVVRAIGYFPAVSAGGPDGIGPQLLVELTHS